MFKLFLVFVVLLLTVLLFPHFFVQQPIPVLVDQDKPFYQHCVIVFDVKKGETLQQVIDNGRATYQDCKE